MSTSKKKAAPVVEVTMPGLDPDVARGLEHLAEQVGAIVRSQRRCCPRCDFWDQTNSICAKFKRLPPPMVIAYACDFFENDIPF